MYSKQSMSKFAPAKEVKSSDHHHHKETHGMRDDIDEKTTFEDVKAPTILERAKEEIEALIQTMNQNNESSSHGTREDNENEGQKQETHSDIEVKTPSFIEEAEESFERMRLREKYYSRYYNNNNNNHHHRRKETHGRSDDIDETTPIDEIKGPSLFERAKEEIEAVFLAICPKKGH